MVTASACCADQNPHSTIPAVAWGTRSIGCDSVMKVPLFPAARNAVEGWRVGVRKKQEILKGMQLVPLAYQEEDRGKTSGYTWE